MGALLRISRVIDRLTAFIGQSVTWLILLSVLVSAGNAISRETWSLSSNAWLDLQWYLFAGAFLLAALPLCRSRTDDQTLRGSGICVKRTLLAGYCQATRLVVC